MTHEHALKNGTVLNNYTIIKILGSGGFGITYLAKDNKLGIEVVIKEYFPNELAVRKDDSTIISKSSSTENDFKKGMQRFEEEAQTLAKFNHPSIVKILGYFEANNTAYFVMEYEEGIDLAQYMKQKSESFTQDEIITIIMPILEGLKEVHSHHYLHRDIKPGNILLRTNKPPVLIDFGASKLAIGEASKSITSMLTEGYAPLEQYNTDIKQQGAFTDIYSIAAVIYKMITGEVPPSAQTRSYNLLQDGRDPFKPLINMNVSGYDVGFLKAVDRALSIKAKDRPQDVQEFQADIVGELVTGTKGNLRKIVTLVIVLLLLVFAGYFYIQQNNPVSSDVIAKPVIEKVKDTNQEELIKTKKELEALKLKNEKEVREIIAEKKRIEKEKKEQQVKKHEREKQEKVELEKQKLEAERLRLEKEKRQQTEAKKKKEKQKVLKQQKYLFDTSGIVGIAQIGKSMKSVNVPNEFNSRNNISKEFAEGDYYEISTILILENNKILAEISEWDKVINEIIISSNDFLTNKGAGVGMNLRALLSLYPKVKLVRTMVEEYERFFVQIDRNIQFEVDKKNYIGKELEYQSMVDIPIVNMKKNTKIQKIRIYRDSYGTTVTNTNTDFQLSQQFSDPNRRAYPYVCYESKTFLSNGKSKYENCTRVNTTCTSLRKSHFGKYPNDLKAHQAFERCLRSGIQ